MRALVEKHMAKLPRLERVVLVARYGIGGGYGPLA